MAKSGAQKAREYRARAIAKDPDFYRKQYQADKRRAGHIRRTYGLSGEQWQEMFDRQEGACAVCRTKTATCVDHDHATGAVRALLCRNCNAGIGHLGDDLEILERAVEYLRTWTVTLG